MFREHFQSHFIVFVGSGKGIHGALLIIRLLLLAATPWSRTLPVTTTPPRYVEGGSHVSACFQVKREKGRLMGGTTLGKGQNWSS